MELPAYRMPTMKTMGLHIWEKARILSKELSQLSLWQPW